MRSADGWRALRRGIALGLTAGLVPVAVSACGSSSVKPTAATASVVSAPVRVAHTKLGAVGYRVVGSGPPLVLIMGYGWTMEGWDPRLGHALAQHNRVVMFDNSGVGRTQQLPAPLTSAAVRQAGSRFSRQSGQRLRHVSKQRSRNTQRPRPRRPARKGLSRSPMPIGGPGIDAAGRKIARISVPTLITDGVADQLAPVTNDHILARLIPGARLVLYPDAGHGFLFQDGTPFASLVESFLTGQTRT